MATKPLPWHRRHAIQIAAQLPEDTEDALMVLDCARVIVKRFLKGDGRRRALSVVVPAAKAQDERK